MKSDLSRIELPQGFISVDTDRSMHVLHLDVLAFTMQLAGSSLSAKISRLPRHLWVTYGNKRRPGTPAKDGYRITWCLGHKGEAPNHLYDTLHHLMTDAGVIDGHDAFVFAHVSDSSEYEQTLSTEVVVPKDQSIRGMKWYLVAVVEKT